jgi:hypothetical protein
MTIHMQEFRPDDPLPLYFPWAKLKSRVSFPQDRSLPTPLVDKDKGGLALAIQRNDPMGFDAGALHLISLHLPESIVPNLSCVPRLQTPR